MKTPSDETWNNAIYNRDKARWRFTGATYDVQHAKLAWTEAKEKFEAAERRIERLIKHSRRSKNNDE